jgi:hypothetical protein
MNGSICQGIASLRLLAFDYEGHPRVVAPYCHGFTRGGESLRAIQVRGTSRSGRFGDGKLWTVSKMRGLRVLDEPFAPDDPNYNPDDSAMIRVHCRAVRG